MHEYYENLSIKMHNKCCVVSPVWYIDMMFSCVHDECCVVSPVWYINLMFSCVHDECCVVSPVWYIDMMFSCLHEMHCQENDHLIMFLFCSYVVLSAHVVYFHGVLALYIWRIF